MMNMVYYCICLYLFVARILVGGYNAINSMEYTNIMNNQLQFSFIIHSFFYFERFLFDNMERSLSNDERGVLNNFYTIAGELKKHCHVIIW
jgi:hypothetical protein